VPHADEIRVVAGSGQMPKDRPMESTIDLTVLRKVVGNNPDMLCEIIQDFIVHAEGGIAEIRAAVAREDVEQLKTTAHRLRGSASLVGVNQMLEVCTTRPTGQ